MMQTVVCGCGAQISGANPGAAMEEHRRKVHGESAASAADAALEHMDAAQLADLERKIQDRKKRQEPPAAGPASAVADEGKGQGKGKGKE